MSGSKTLTEIPQHNPSRRRFVLGAAASAVTGPLLLVPGKAKAADQVVISAWGGRYTETMQEAFYRPFTEATGIPVVLGPPPDLARIKAAVRAGNIEYDVIDPLFSWVVEGERDGTWQPIDTTIVDRSDVDPRLNRPMMQVFYLGGGGIIYDETRHGADNQHPKSWREFWDAGAFPGRRCLTVEADRMVVIALMADGVAPRDIYPFDIDRAFRSLDRVKPNVRLWLQNPAQGISTVERNESDFNFSYNGRVFSSRQAGSRVAFVNNQCYVTSGQLLVPRGARNRDAAMRLIDFHLKPERQAAWARIYGYWGSNRKMGDHLSAAERSQIINFSGDNHVIANVEWWADINAEVQRRFREWLLT